MKNRIAIVSAAVASILMSGSASALAPNIPFFTSLTISGSSSFELAFESVLNSASSAICTNGTYNKFKSTVGDFRAYTCTAKASVVDTAAQPIVIYYRGEGGSVWGLTPLLRSMTSLRLDLSACPTIVTPGSLTTIPCNGGFYNAVNDNAASGLQIATSQLGFSDEEADVFWGENYPSPADYATLQPALNKAERATLTNNSVAVVAQAFGVFITDYPTSSGGNSAQNQLSTFINSVGTLPKGSISNIFLGVFSDWSQVPNSSGGTVTTDPLPIKLCRRNAGSGAQVAMSLCYDNYAVTGMSFASIAAPGNFDILNSGGGGVVDNPSTDRMRSCLANTTDSNGNPVGAIGFMSAEEDLVPTSSQAGYKMINGDGIATANDMSALISGPETCGSDCWFELVATKKAGLSGTPLTFANKLITVLQTQSTGPTTPNVAFLLGLGGNTQTWGLTALAGKKYVSCNRRFKNSLHVPASWQC